MSGDDILGEVMEQLRGRRRRRSGGLELEGVAVIPGGDLMDMLKAFVHEHETRNDADHIDGLPRAEWDKVIKQSNQIKAERDRFHELMLLMYTDCPLLTHAMLAEDDLSGSRTRLKRLVKLSEDFLARVEAKNKPPADPA